MTTIREVVARWARLEHAVGPTLADRHKSLLALLAERLDDDEINEIVTLVHGVAEDPAT